MATQESSGVIEALSDALWRDESLFTDRERGLLASVLHHARSDGDDAQTRQAVARRIAAAVGETIAQRIVEGIGGAIAPRLLASYVARVGVDATDAVTQAAATVAGPGPHPRASVNFAGPGPHPKASVQLAGPGPHPKEQNVRGPGGPHPGPAPSTGGPGGPHPGPAPTTGGPGGPHPGPAPRGPGGPHPGPNRGHGPGGPHGPKHGPGGPRGKRKAHAGAEGAFSAGSAPVLVLDEFLAPQELERLSRYVQDRESDFVLSEVVAPGATAGVVDFEHRKSRVLYDLGEHEAAISGRILSYLPRILPAVGVDAFPIARVEAQITASNHGDFFRPHEDNGEPPLQTRELTFVYFFHREPKAFRGGELRIYDSPERGSYRAIVPQQNQIVFFPSHLVHEITPVECPSGAFLASRFTLNGWFHRPE